MRSLCAFLSVGLALAVPGAAEPAGKAPGGEAVPLSRCYCAQLTGGMPPYYIARLVPVVPECAGVTYDLKGKRPWENGLLSCDDLKKCEKGLEKYAGKRKILDARTAEAKKRLETCCALPKEELRAQEPCSNKCGRDWSAVLKVLAAETEKLDKAEAKERERCAAKAQKTEKVEGEQ